MSRLQSWLWPVATAGLVLGLTAVLWRHEQGTEHAQLRDGFEHELRQATARIEQRLALYEQTLQGVQALLMANRTLDRPAFALYVDTLRTNPNLAGMQGIAYGPLLMPGRVGLHEEDQRRAGLDGYTVWPAVGAAGANAHAPITYIAPLNARNRKAYGYDPYADPMRREAMERAADSGQAAITATLNLAVDEPDANQPPVGFVMFLPVYDSSPRLLQSAAERRRHVEGWVWAGFRATDLMGSVYGVRATGLALQLYDGSEPGLGGLLYASHDPAERREGGHAEARFDNTALIGFAGRTWTLRAQALPEFEQTRRGHVASRVIAATGVALALLLATLAQRLVMARQHARVTARSTLEALRASERRYRHIVDAANEGIWTIDAQARISFANPRMLQMMACVPDDMVGRPVRQFIAEAQHGANLLAETALPHIPRELKLRRCNGGEFWASLSVTRIQAADGSPAGALAMVTDITEAKAAEQGRAMLETQLRASQKMEAIGTLAGGIAHDFNNILAAILGNAALAREHVDTAHPAHQNLEQIDRAGARARGLVQQILAFSRRQPQVRVSQPLRPLVEESIRLLRSTLPAQVDIETVLGDEPLHVSADATQIQQILMNLCTNAWHALLGSPGRVTVTLSGATLDEPAAQRLGGVSPGRYAHLSVRDTGSGMDASTRERIFEPFFTTKRVGQGTGLGLSVVHGIVTAHDGAISVDSAPGRGSTFHVYLPLAPATSVAAAAAPEAPRAPARTGRGEHVMYVDDDVAMLVLVERLLQRAGYRVTCHDNPRYAIAELRAQPSAFDVVVSDYNMPELSGMDLAQETMLLAPGLPVVISSGYISDEMRAMAERIGVHRLLQKEYTLEQLPEIIRSALAETAH